MRFEYLVDFYTYRIRALLAQRLPFFNATEEAMLRIDVQGNEQKPLIELAGRVIGPWVDELRSQCRRLLELRARLTLDLGQVSFVDSAGAGLLLELQAQRVELVNCSRFVAEQLRVARQSTDSGGINEHQLH